jgi:TPR repeat protein
MFFVRRNGMSAPPSKAQVHLARLYLKGSGVPESPVQAVKLLERAARHNNPEAQYLLGRVYWEGRGGPQDRVQAHMWFNLAAAQGHENASSMRQVVATEMSQNQLVEAQRLAVQQSKGQ